MRLITFLLTLFSTVSKHLYLGIRHFKYICLFAFLFIYASGSFAYDFNYDKAQGLYKQGNYKGSFQILSEGYSKWHMPSCYRTGKTYEFCKGVKQDYAEALKYYRRLCDKAEGHACTNTG